MASILGALLAPSGLAYGLFALGLLTCLKVQWRRLSWGLLAVAYRLPGAAGRAQR